MRGAVSAAAAVLQVKYCCCLAVDMQVNCICDLAMTVKVAMQANGPCQQALVHVDVATLLLLCLIVVAGWLWLHIYNVAKVI